MHGTCIKTKLDPLLCRILNLLNDALPTCNLTDSYSYILQAVCTCRCSYSENAMQIDKGISWIVYISVSQPFRRRGNLDLALHISRYPLRKISIFFKLIYFLIISYLRDITVYCC